MPREPIGRPGASSSTFPGSWIPGEWRKGFTDTYSVTFDGVDEYVDLGTSSNLNPEDITIAMWIKPDALTNYDYLFTRGSADYFEAYRFEIGATDLFCAFGNGSSNGWLSRAHGMSNGNWYHAAVTYDGATAALYVDGAMLGATESISIVMEQATRNSYIAKPLGTGAYFDGLIDEAAIWSRALSAVDITAIYNGGTPQSLASYNPTGWWRMGDGDTFPTLQDWSSTGTSAGTMTNMESGDITADTP